jgi:hypothetical protein
VHTMADGRQIFCICINGSKMEEFNNRGAFCDGRILARKMNTLGCPEVPLSEVVAASKEYDLGWKISGPVRLPGA